MRSVGRAALIASCVALATASSGGCGSSDNTPIAAPAEGGVADLAKKRAERGKAGAPAGATAPAKP